MKRLIIAFLLVGLLVLSGCGSTKYVCPDGSTIVTNLGDCPKKAKLTVDLDCRAICSQGFTACGNFPDTITGEIKLNAEEKTVSGVTLEYELHGKTDKTVKYQKYKNIGNIDTTSEKTITFDYSPGDLSEVYDGGVGFPGGIVGMEILLKVNCDDCEITLPNSNKVFEDEATYIGFCFY